MRSRLITAAGALALLLEGCVTTGPVAPPADPAVAERARAAGLLAEARAEADRDAAALALSAPRMAYPILVPSDLGEFRLDGATVDDDAEDVYYRLRYRRPDGVCFTVSGSGGGEGRRLSRLTAPHDTTSVVIRSLHVPVVVYQARADQEGNGSRWRAGDVTTGSIEADGLSVTLMSRSDGDGECRALSLAEAVTLVAGLRPLDPADDLDGAYRPLEVEAIEQSEGVDSEALARAAFGSPARPGEVTVETVRRTDLRAVVLVTRRGTGGPEVRDEQTRAVYVRADEGSWRLVSAGQRTRCLPGRGHTDWSAAPCG